MVSFKKRREGRGNKGVGATFLAYNYDNVKIQTKRDGSEFCVVLGQGRNWADDTTGSVPRPTFIQAGADSSELVSHRPAADPPSDETGYFDVPASM